MPRPSADTRAEIREAARELFAGRGVDQTSLREIAERVGITKAALYYHYASKDALLNDLIDPLFDDMRALGEEFEAGPIARREVLESFWDLCLRHRPVLRVLINDPNVVARGNVAPRFLQWRRRIDAVLVGEALEDRIRAMIALGGLQDVVVIIDLDQLAEIRETAIDAALRALTP